MDRKLRQSVLALSLTSVACVLTVTSGLTHQSLLANGSPKPLLAKWEVSSLGPMKSPPQSVFQARQATTRACIAAMQAKIHAHAIATHELRQAAALATNAVVEAALLSTVAEISAEPDASLFRDGISISERTQKRHLRRAREALALPYFSFAQDLRRNRS